MGSAKSKPSSAKSKWNPAKSKWNPAKSKLHAMEEENGSGGDEVKEIEKSKSLPIDK